MKRIFSLFLAVAVTVILASCGEEAEATPSADISVAETVSETVSLAPPTPSVGSNVEVQAEDCVYGDELNEFLGDSENLMDDYFSSYSEISVTKGFDWDGSERPELGKEVAPNLFDGDTATKWCCSNTDVEGISAVVWSMKSEVTVTNYTFTTANDNAEYIGRNPVSWRLYGTNSELNTDMAMTDGMFNSGNVPEGWVLIDEVKSTTLPDENFTECGFAVDEENRAAYSGYMLLIDSVDYTNDVFQMSELDLYGNE